MNNLISENEFDSMSDSEIEFDNTQNEKVFTMQPCSNQSKKICLQNFISNNTLPSRNIFIIYLLFILSSIFH